MSASFLDTLDSVSDFTGSDAFKSGTDFLKTLTGYNGGLQADAMARTSYEQTLDGITQAESAALSAFQFNSVVEGRNLASQLNALRVNRDEIISNQRAQAAANGVGNSRSALQFTNETLSRGERTAVDLRIASEARRKAAELGLESTLSQLTARRRSANMRERQREKGSGGFGGFLDSVTAGIGFAQDTGKLFD